MITVVPILFTRKLIFLNQSSQEVFLISKPYFLQYSPIPEFLKGFLKRGVRGYCNRECKKKVIHLVNVFQIAEPLVDAGNRLLLSVVRPFI